MTTNPGIGAVGGTGPSTLGTTGAPYGSEAMEQMVADRIRELKASGRPAQRMAVIRELASQGAIQTMQPRPTNLTEDQHEQALTQSLPAEQRAKQVASQARQGHTPQPDGAGPTLTGGVAQQAQHTRPRASARPVMPTEGPAPTAAQLSSATSARVGGLVDQVVRLAEARGWPLEHALGAVWAYHGAERNRYPEGAWAGVLQDLGIELPPQG